MIFEAPKTEPYDEVEIYNDYLYLKQPQISSGLAMVPVISKNLKKAPKFLNEMELNKDIYFLDDTGSFDSLRINNQSGLEIIIPPATHLVGGKQNRGIDKIQLLEYQQSIIVDVHCFEPNRSRGQLEFHEIQSTPLDVVYQTMTTKGTGASWDPISTYTEITRKGTSLLSFLKATDKERAHLALNFETLQSQTGVVSIFGKTPVFRNNSFAVLELFPNNQVFNLHRNQIYKGKFASLLWKCIRNQIIPQLTLNEVYQKTEKFLTSLNSLIKNIISKEPKDTKDYHAVSINKKSLVSDLILDDNDQIIYLVAMQMMA